MPESTDTLRALFIDKPERIIRFPEWMLPAAYDPFSLEP